MVEAYWIRKVMDLRASQLWVEQAGFQAEHVREFFRLSVRAVPNTALANSAHAAYSTLPIHPKFESQHPQIAKEMKPEP